MWNDPIVTEVRAIRDQLSSQFGFNVHSIFEDLRSREDKLGRQLVRTILKPKVEQGASLDHHSTLLHGGR